MLLKFVKIEWSIITFGKICNTLEYLKIKRMYINWHKQITTMSPSQTSPGWLYESLWFMFLHLNSFQAKIIHKLVKVE